MSIHSNNKPAEATNNEISLKYLAFFVLKKWRFPFWSTLVCAILVLAYLLVTQFAMLGDDAYMSVSRYHYDNAVSSYTNKVEALKDEIAAIDDNLSRQKTYYDESLLMQIDPYSEMVASSVYYIDTGYLIIPENTYQDIDHAGRLIKMYLAYLSGDIYAKLMEQFTEITDAQYFKEIITTTADYTTSTITVTVIGDDAAMEQEMLDIFRAGMNEVYSDASKTIAEHKLTEINSTIYSVADSSLADKKQASFEKMVVLSGLLQEKNLALQKLQTEEGEPQWEFSVGSIVMKSVKSAILAAVLACIAAILSLALFYVFTDKILDADKLQSLCACNILGYVPRDGNRPMKKLDRAAAAVSGIRRHTEDRKSAVALTARSICATVLGGGIRDGSIALAGSIGMDELKGIAAEFNEAISDEPLRFTAAGSPMMDVSSIQTLEAAQTTVLVEKQGYSLCSDVIKENARIADWGKPVLGAVLLDSDAR